MSAVKSKPRKREYSPEEREAYKAEKRETERKRIEESVRQLLNSEGWARWAETRATFHDYSLGNCMLIASQMPEASRVAGFRAWQALGRQVSKGEHAIWIMAPMSVKRENAKGEEERVTFFRAVPVFDISQTEGEELAEMPRSPIEGDSHSDYLPRLEAFAAEIGFTVSYEDLGEALGGYCRKSDSTIAINTRKSPNGQVRTLVHEIAHALGVYYTEYGRDSAEVIVETAAVIVCGAIGLDTSGESIPYIAAWGEKSDLAAIRTYAEKVDECATRIEKAIQS